MPKMRPEDQELVDDIQKRLRAGAKGIGSTESRKLINIIERMKPSPTFDQLKQASSAKELTKSENHFVSLTKERIWHGQKSFSALQMNTVIGIFEKLLPSPIERYFCSWSFRDGYWLSSCEMGVTFENDDMGPYEAEVDTCPSCGKQVYPIAV